MSLNSICWGQMLHPCKVPGNRKHDAWGLGWGLGWPNKYGMNGWMDGLRTTMGEL